MIEITGILLFVYVMGVALGSLGWAEGEYEFYHAVFWPLAITKYLMRGLWLILTTGWKP